MFGVGSVLAGLFLDSSIIFVDRHSPCVGHVCLMLVIAQSAKLCRSPDLTRLTRLHFAESAT